MNQYGCFIDGAWLDATDGRVVDLVDPATGRHLATVARGGAADIDAAVQAARDAFHGVWRRTPPVERGRILWAIAQRILRDQERLATIESQDTGKPYSQAIADCVVAARYFEFFAGAADKILGTTIPLGPKFMDYTEREPLGVTAQIIPWNYPLQMSARGIAPALAAGNTVVVKPAEEACLTALELARICSEEGLPPGVVNIVPGLGPEAGAALASHPGIDLLAFTGSVETGSVVMGSAASTVTPVLLELGGKSPNIVFADADLDRALPFLLRSAYQHAGQTCSAASRILVEARIHDQLVERLVETSSRLRLGPGLSDPDMGPVVSPGQRDRVLGYLDVARDEGAEVVIGGGAAFVPDFEDGYFVQPTILDAVKRGMRVHREEIFGPVLTVTVFDSVDEATELANDTPYGLVAGIWTRDIGTAHHLAREIDAGQVFINTYGAGGGVELPFGGTKKSGFGREKGLEAFTSYTRVKNVCIALDG